MEDRFGSRVLATFTRPGKLAPMLRERAPWLDVLLISTVIALVSVAVMPDETFLEPMRDAVSRRGRPVEITSSPDVIVRWGKVMAMLSTLATHPIVVFTIAGALMVVFAFALRASVSFRELLSLTAHAMLIPALGTLAAIAARLAAGWDRGFGLGILLDPPAAPGFLLGSVLSVDPFLVWMLVVLGIGLHRLDPRISTLRSSTLLVGAYLVLVLTSTALLHPEFG